jgi:hypothetical protein
VILNSAPHHTLNPSVERHSLLNCHLNVSRLMMSPDFELLVPFEVMPTLWLMHQFVT